MSDGKNIPPRQSSARDIPAFLKWTIVIALIVGLLVSLFLCWQLQQQLDQVRDEQELAKRELAAINRVEVVEQSGVFKLETILGRGKPVYFPKPYDAPPAITFEPIFRPFANVGGEVNEARLKEFQEMQDRQTLKDFKTAMKAFDLVAVHADHFRWETHSDRAGGSFPVVEVKWTPRGLIGSKRKTAK